MVSGARSVRRGVLLAVVCFGAWTAPLAAQTLRGRILDSETGAPVMLAYVGLVEEGENMVVAGLADAQGTFSLDAPDPGSYFVYVARSGYETIMDGLFELGEDGVFEVRIGLKPRPIEIDPVTVEATGELNYLESQGFYDRAIASRGTFLIREDIERLTTHRLVDAFRNIPMVQVDATFSMTSGAGSLENPSIKIRRPNRREACSPTLYVDRHMVATGVNAEIRPDDYINPRDVEAIEIYARSSEVPLEFDEVNHCGVVLIWTRER